MERVSSEDSLLQRRDVREAAYLRPCNLGGEGNTPCSVVWVCLVSFGRVPESCKRQELLPSVGVGGIPGVPG